MKIVLIPCGATEWCGEGRLLGRSNLSLSDAGAAQAAQWVDVLRPLELARIYHSPDELAKRTAKILGAALDVSTRVEPELAEVDLGLWAGLTEAELKSRFAKAHRQLVDAPLNVSPPGGEQVADAAERVVDWLRRRLKRNGKETVGLVMRPLSRALARCALGELEIAGVWDARRERDPVVIEREQAQAAVASGKRGSGSIGV